MKTSLSDSLSGLVLDGSLAVAVPVAALAGLVSFLSPCVLPLVPAYLSYVTGLTGAELAGEGTRPRPEGRAPRSTPAAGTLTAELVVRRSRVVLGTGLFVAGFTAVFVSYGLAFGGLGGLLREHQDAITRVLGGVTVLLGLGFAGWLPLPDRYFGLRSTPPRRLGVFGAPMFGVLFGLGWTPCIGPTLAAVQTLAFTEATAMRGAVLSAAYCVGLGLPFLGVGLAFRRALGGLEWVRRHQRQVMRAGGLMMITLGLLLLTGTWGILIAGLQGWIRGYQVVL